MRGKRVVKRENCIRCSKRLINTYTPIEIELSNHFFHFLLGRTSQRRGVEIVKLVERQQLGQVGERLVAYSVDDLVTLLDFIDDVVTDFRVLPKRFDT